MYDVCTYVRIRTYVRKYVHMPFYEHLPLLRCCFPGESDRVSGIQNLMETFLSSAAAVAPPITQSSTSCNGAATNGYLHSPVIKQAEAV